MRNLSLFTLLAFVLISPLIVVAQSPPAPQSSKPDYSQEAFVLEQFSSKVKFEDDGTSSEENSARVRIQSDAGVQRYGLLTFSYASGTGTFEIEYVRVHKPDGTLVLTPPDNIQDMAAEITRQAPFYSDLREKHVAVKGLGVGDILEYKTVERVTKPLAPGQFWLEYGFSHDFILLQEQLEVSVPRERAIKWKSPEVKPKISEVGQYRVYTWSSSSLERKKKDEKDEKVEEAKTTWEQARGRFPQPDVLLSSFQSWDELGHWYGSLQNDRVKPTAEIQAKAAELTKGAADDDAKLRAIYKYVSTDFRYIGIAFGVGRYQPHFAAEVLANQYGDCKDKHTLLASLLNAAGIKAYPALISSAREIDADMPSPSEFNHVITVIPRGNTLVWLDTTTEVGTFQYLLAPLRNKHALVIWGDRPAELINTPEDLPFPATENFHMDAKLSGDGTLQGDAEISTRGDVEYVFRSAFRTVPMPQWKELAQRISLNLGFGGEVSDVTASPPEKTDEPFRFSYKYVRKEYADWPNRRILAPAPAMALPLLTDEAAASSVPLWLGPPLELAFHSQIEIPKGYSLEVPASIHVKRDFAEFDSTYTLKDGKLISDRHLRTISVELPKTASDQYIKFCKTIQNDYQAFIPLLSERASPADEVSIQANSIMNSIRSLPDSSNPEALRLETEAREALGRRDQQGAISSLYRAVSADPKFVRAWITLGGLLMTAHQLDSGRDAFQKAIAANPKEPITYKMFAFSITDSRPAEAVPTWREYIKLAPEDADGFFNLGSALLKSQRYGEAAQAMESAVKLKPDRTNYQLQLTVAYLRAENDEKATAALRRLLEMQPGPEMLNQAAYETEKRDKLLPVALEYAQKAVRAEEETSTKIDNANLRAEDESQTHKLAAYWSTLGWLQGRANKLEEAEKTLKAAWQLTQNGVAAARLCELYEREHKTQAAIHMCRFASYRLPLEQEPALYHISELLGENNKRLEHLGPGAANSPNTVTTSDEIFHMRNFKLLHLVSGTETGEVLMLLAYDLKPGKFHVEDVKYVSGSEKLKTLDKTLRALNFNFTSPDGNPLQVVIHGTLSCYPLSGCQFVLLDAPSGRLVKLRVQEQE